MGWGIAVVLLGTFLFMALVTLWDWHNELRLYRKSLIFLWNDHYRMKRVAEEQAEKYTTLGRKYAQQSADTQQVLVSLTPLIEQTDWLGPQPYGTGLAQLQAKERARNLEIQRIRKLLMNLPLVSDYVKARNPVLPGKITL